MTDLLSTHDKQVLAAQQEMLQQHSEDRLWAEVYTAEFERTNLRGAAIKEADNAVQYLRQSRNHR